MVYNGRRKDILSDHANSFAHFSLLWFFVAIPSFFMLISFAASGRFVIVVAIIFFLLPASSIVSAFCCGFHIWNWYTLMIVHSQYMKRIHNICFFVRFVLLVEREETKEKWFPRVFVQFFSLRLLNIKGLHNFHINFESNQIE